MTAPRTLSDLVAVDLGVGIPTALMAKFLLDLGASVWKAAPPAGDPSEAHYPAYSSWYDRARRTTPEAAGDLLSTADVVLVGGEDHPGLPRRHDAAALAAANPCLVVVDVRAYADGFEERPGVDVLVAARMGYVFETFTDRPVYPAFPMPSYGAALQGLLGMAAALVERARSGRGQVVSTSLQQGLAALLSPVWGTYADTGKVNMRNPPKGVRLPVVRTADGEFVCLSPRMNGMEKVFAAFGIEGDPGDWSKISYFGDLELFQRHAAGFDSEELLAAFAANDVAAEKVRAPGECWDDEQVQVNGIIVTDSAGRRRAGAPVTLRSRPGPELPGGADEPARSPAAPLPENAPPLAGLRILDFGAMVAGPYGSRLLADLGADVIKIEPLAGDVMRAASYPHFAPANAGKRSICLDAKSVAAREVIRRLCATATAAQHNFRVGAAERLGLDPATLREYQPGLVHLHASAYGPSGPRSRNSGLDPLMQMYCGHAVRAGGQGGTPLWIRNMFVDYAAGTLGAIGVLLGVHEQMVTGTPVEAETNLLDTGLFLMSELVQDSDGTFSGAPLLNRELTGYHCTDALYQSADGWVAVAARSDAMAARLATELGLTGFPAARFAWGDAEWRRLGEAIRAVPTAALLARLDAAEVWSEPCVEDGWQQLTTTPAAAAAQLVVTTPDPTVGTMALVGPAVSFSRSCLDPARPLAVPARGADTRRVLTEVGFTEAEIEELIAAQVVAGS
ncbi:CoA transferase [Georgenia sp. AZ-5]|uniref:CaiB/BaiF CoA-transferase family protein n=1 Tax=Georgenia sp. AZ-5 TaxID=3367526 RepID=UPI0037546D2A